MYATTRYKALHRFEPGCLLGAAFDDLQSISDIDVVRPDPYHVNSIAFVYLRQDIIPDIVIWISGFENIATQSYQIHGIEIAKSGEVFKAHQITGEQLKMAGKSNRPEIIFATSHAGSKFEWGRKTQTLREVTEVEMAACEDAAACANFEDN